MEKILLLTLIVTLYSKCAAQGNNFCDSEPCLNNGGCVAFFDVSYLCFCTEQFTGRNCETPLTPCSSSPCKNGATCEVFLDVSYFCVCRDGFTGETCSDAITTMPPPTTLFQRLSTLLSTTVNGGTSGSDGDICGTVVTSRIVGGRDASLGSYPWQGYLVARNVFCGCSLIDNEWAITAAHCLDATSQVYLDGVAFGNINLDAPKNSTVFTTVEQIILHPGYNSLTFDNDIALLHLTNPISYSVNVRPICLETSLDETTLYENCDASGFGSTSYGSPVEPMLQEVELTLFERDQCNNLDVTENQICAGGDGKGICPGDSGGPLACQRNDGRFSLVGVSSFFNGVNDSCGEYSSGFARVSKYNDFLTSAFTNQGLAVNCEPIELDVCTQVLPYSLTYTTSQEDLVPRIESVRNATRYDECHPHGTLLSCALVFHECNTDSEQEQNRLCRQICLDVLQACNITFFSSACSMFPIGATPDQMWCPSGPDPICNQHFDLQSEPVFLRSPNFPEEYYNTLNCEWTISAPEGYNIIAKIRNFTTEEGYDFIVIGSGPDPSNRSTAFIRESGLLPPGSRLFPTNELWMIFASDSGVVSPGFEIELLAVSNEAECLNGSLLCSVENICIPNSWQCDGVADCINQDDEKFCDAECESTISGFCQNLPYSEVSFVNSEVQDDTEAQAVFSILEGFVGTCPGEDRLFLCALLYPECPRGGFGYFPCREACEMVMMSCPTLLLAANVNCSQLPSGVSQGNGICLPGSSTEMPTSSRVLTNFSTSIPDMTTNLPSTMAVSESEIPGTVMGSSPPVTELTSTGAPTAGSTQVTGTTRQSVSHQASTESTGTAISTDSMETDAGSSTQSMRTDAGSTLPPGVVSVSGVCESYLDYSVAQSEPISETISGISAEVATASVEGSERCVEVMAGVCSLFFPPLQSSDLILCQETCNQIFDDCFIVSVFFVSLTPDICLDLPPRAEVGNGRCIGDEIMPTLPGETTLPTTMELSSTPIPQGTTSSVTTVIRETTASTTTDIIGPTTPGMSTIPPNTIRVVGACENYLDYKFARTDTQFELTVQLSPQIATESIVNSGLCESIPAMCSLFYPPLTSSNMTLCQEACSLIFMNCEVAVPFFTNFNPMTCGDFPPRENAGSDTCIEDEMNSTTEGVSTAQTTASAPTSLPVSTTIGATTSATTSQEPAMQTTQAPPNSLPVTGVCTEYLDYQFAEPMPLLELVIDISLEIPTVTVVDSGLCADELLPAMCSLYFPPLFSSNMTLCQETCNQIFQDCDIAFAFFGEFPESTCNEFPLRSDSGNSTCIGDEISTTTVDASTTSTTLMSTPPVTTTQTTTVTTPRLTTKATSRAPPNQVPVTGVCTEYLDYQFAEPMPLLELVVDISLEIPTMSVVDSGLCADELLPAMCSLYFPPLFSSNMTLCQETCNQIFQDCDIAFAFFGEFPESTCIEFPLRSDSGNSTCIGDEVNPTTTSASTTRTTMMSSTTVETTSATTPSETTEATSQGPTAPPISIPVTGVCTEYLDYQFAEPMPLLELVVDISLEIPTMSVVDSGLCADELLPAMCSLYFPPLFSSNMTLCQETCNQIFQDCDIALAFFRAFPQSTCINFPLSSDSGNLNCVGEEKTLTTISASTAGTTQMSSSPVTTVGIKTSTPPPSETTKAASPASSPTPEGSPVVGPCQNYLEYQFSQSEPVYEVVLSLTPLVSTTSIINSGLCEDVLPAMCSLFFPPLPLSKYTLCRETCNQIFVDCGAVSAFLVGFTPNACLDFPLRADADAMCIGDEVMSTTTVATRQTTLGKTPVATSPGGTSGQTPQVQTTIAGSTAAPTTTFRSTAAPTTTFRSTATPKTTLRSTAAPTTTFRTTATPKTTFRSTSAPKTTFRSTTAPTTTFRSTTAVPTSTETTERVSVVPPDSVPVIGICEDYLDYSLAQSEPLFAMVVSLPLDVATESIRNSGLCDDLLLPAMCSVFYPPLPSSNIVLCQESCSKIFTDCGVALAFFRDFTENSCQDFPLSEESGGDSCVGDGSATTLGMSSFPTTFDATTPTSDRETSVPMSSDKTTVLTSSVTSTPAESVPVVGICEAFLPYQFAQPEPVLDLVISLSAEAITDTILNSGLCDADLLPAMCSLFFPPLPSSNFVLCRDTCSDIFVNCRAAVAFFRDITEGICLDTPVGTEDEDVLCIQDEIATTLGQSSSPTIFDATTPTTDRETSVPMSSDKTTVLTSSVTSTPAESVPVVGICEAFLPYQFAQPEPVLDLVISLSAEAITDTILNSGLCDADLLPAMCSLFFPPLPSSNFVLCRDTCSDIFVNCRAAVAFFRDITEGICLDTPVGTEDESAVCIGDEISTTEGAPSSSTKFGTTVSPTTSQYTSLPMSSGITEVTPSETILPIDAVPVAGVCQDYLDYNLAEPETLFELVTTLPLDAATASIAGTGLCEEILPAVCSLFFPPLPSSGRVLCRESCRQIFTNCPVVAVFFPDFSQQSCSKFPKRAKAGDDVCVGDEVPTTLSPERTTISTTPFIVVDYLCDFLGCENGGTCSDNDEGGRECFCPPGFSGELCEEFPCDRLGCQNGGLCFPNAIGDKVCFCPAEFSGDFCELSLTPVPSTPAVPTTIPVDFPCDIFGCENGGFCFPNENDIKVCFCPVDFSGEFCEISLKSTPSPSPQPTTVPLTTEPPSLTTIAPCTPDELQPVQGLCQQVLPYDEALLEPNFPLLRDDFSLTNIISIITSNSLCDADLIAGMCYLFYPPCPTSNLFLCPETCRAIFQQINGCSAITTFLGISEAECSSLPVGQDVGNGLCVERGPTTLAPTTTGKATTPQPQTTTPVKTPVATTISTTPVPTTEVTSSPILTDTTLPVEASSPTPFTPGDTTIAPECYDVPLFCRDVITYEMTPVRPDLNLEQMYQQFQIIFACHVDMKLYACTYLYPPCEPLQSRSLCMETCSEVEDSCGNTNLFGKLEFNCNEFTDAAKGPDGLCRAGFLGSTSEAPTTTSGPTETDKLSTSQRITPMPIMCEPVHPRCLEVLPYSMGVRTISASVIDNFLDIHFGLPSSCDERYRKLLCADLYKPCPGSGFGRGFCSDVCEDIQSSCQLFFAFFPTLSFPVNCETLPDDIFNEELYDEYGLCN